MSRYEEYIARLIRTGRYTSEEARNLSVSREVEKYYEGEDKEAPTLHHEFICCSEC